MRPDPPAGHLLVNEYYAAKTGAAEIISVRQKVHIFTHIEWHMAAVHLLVTRMPDCFTWVTPAQLAAETALPTAFRICLPKE